MSYSSNDSCANWTLDASVVDPALLDAVSDYNRASTFTAFNFMDPMVNPSEALGGRDLFPDGRAFYIWPAVLDYTPQEPRFKRKTLGVHTYIKAPEGFRDFESAMVLVVSDYAKYLNSKWTVKSLDNGGRMRHESERDDAPPIEFTFHNFQRRFMEDLTKLFSDFGSNRACSLATTHQSHFLIQNAARVDRKSAAASDLDTVTYREVVSGGSFEVAKPWDRAETQS